MFFFYVGATNPEYVVGADDVDKLLAVECIPMDEKGHQVFYQKLCIVIQNIFYMPIVYEILKSRPDCFLDHAYSFDVLSYLIIFSLK